MSCNANKDFLNFQFGSLGELGGSDLSVNSFAHLLQEYFQFLFFQVLSLLLLPDGLTKHGFLNSASSHIQRGKYDI